MEQYSKLKELKHDKGVAGLTLFLSLITFLFVIGLLVMVFALMGGELQTATYDSTTTVTVSNETGAWLNTTTYTVDNSGARDFASLTITEAINVTDNTSIGTGNFTVSGTGFTNASVTTWSDVWVSYTYTWSADNSATDIMSDTTDAVAGATDWFAIFVVIGAMVVLILLTVIIIKAVRGSGLMGESSGGNSSEGSA